MDFDEAERQLLASATDDLPALTVARSATNALARTIEGAHVPPAPENAPPSYYARSAILLLAVIGLRTARACLLVVSAGYWPESHGLKRRLSESHARAQAVANDTTGQHAREWLEGRGPSTPPRIVGKFGSPDLWKLYSWGAHAEAQSVQQWLSLPLPDIHEAHTGLVVPPHHEETFSNALLVECAMECRDLAMAQAVCRESTLEAIEARKVEIRTLDAEIEPMMARYYAAPKESDESSDS